MAKLSIVIPVYFNQENLPTTIPRLIALKQQLFPHQLELIFVDDGSGDKSLEMLLEAQRQYPQNIVVVKLTRNFGSIAAVQAGLMHTTGDCIGLISADLQDPPEMFIEMFKHWQAGVKAVYAVRQARKDSFSQRMFSSLFYYLLRGFAIRNYPEQGFDVFLIDREVVNKLNQISESHTNLMALIFWLGYTSVSIPYVRQAREKGTSRWTFSKKIKLFIDSFVSFSYMPIRFMSLIGIFYALSAFAYSGYLIYIKLIYDSPVEGWTALMVFNSFTMGLLLIMLGILGEYVWRISDTIKRRPQYVVDRVIDSNTRA